MENETARITISCKGELIGLHHAGGSQMKKLNSKPGVYESNEGIWMKAILDAMAAELG